MGNSRSRSRRSFGRSHSKSRSKMLTGIKVPVDFAKNMYYTKGNSIIQMRRSTKAKKAIGKFRRQPGFLYYVDKAGNLCTSRMKTRH